MGVSVARKTEAFDQTGTARERILTAASDLFLTEGILGSGVDRLVGASGVAKATFYRQFPSKDDVIVAWLRRPEARWIEAVLARLDREHDSPLERLLSFWDAVDEWERKRGYPGCAFLNTLVEIRDRHHPARAVIASFIAEVDEFFITNARDAGVPDPAEIGRQLRTLAMGTFMAMRLQRSSEAARRARAAAVSLLAQQLGTTPETLEASID
jgi:AcrR family transcriptional regulator